MTTCSLHKSNLRNIISYALAIISGITLCMRHLHGVAIPLPVVTVLSLALFLLNIGSDYRINLPLLLLTGIVGISLISNPFPELSLRTQRFIAFSTGMPCLSPLIVTERLSDVRKLLLKTTLITLSVSVVISFMIWIYTLTPLCQNSEDFTYYGFRGLFNKGMSLSPVAAVTSVWSAYRIFHTSSRSTSLWLTLTIVSILTCICAGSRIALVGLVASLCFIFFINKTKIIHSLKKKRYRIAAIFICAITALAIPKAMTSIILKNNVAQSHGTWYYSRQELWNDRIAEFKSSPVIGIGYANRILHEDESPGDLRKMEPGSSYLSLLSNTGLIGMSMFLCFLATLAIRSCKISTRKNIQALTLPLSLLIFLLINGITEGWLLYSGGMMSPIFWLACSSLIHNTSNLKSSTRFYL